MPRNNGTGPAGLGPMTGRGAGFCAGNSVPGYANPMPGQGVFGMGLGRGRARGMRNGYWATGVSGWTRVNSEIAPFIPSNQQSEVLKTQAKLMQENLNALNGRIQELETLAAEKNQNQE